MGVIKWNYEKCYEEAKKYSCRVDFQRNKIGAYKAALKNRWLDDYYWMKTPEKPNKIWRYENCKEESMKYKTLREFEKNNKSAYNAARKNKWLNEFTWLKREKECWTYEKCYEEAKKYHTRTEFQKSNGSAYQAAYKNGWIDEYDWIPKRKKVESKWTKEIVWEIAKNFKTKSEFERTEKGCYLAALRAGWLSEMDWFVPAVIEKLELFNEKHCVYEYVDEVSKTVYIGLTYNLRTRHLRHKKSGAVYKYFTSIGKEIPQPIILKDELVMEDARYYEDFFVKVYRLKGYNILNTGSTGRYCGSCGGGRVKYTKDVCFEIASKYSKLKDFRENEASCYGRAYSKGWIKEFTWLEKDPRFVNKS